MPLARHSQGMSEEGEGRDLTQHLCKGAGFSTSVQERTSSPFKQIRVGSIPASPAQGSLYSSEWVIEEEQSILGTPWVCCRLTAVLGPNSEAVQSKVPWATHHRALRWWSSAFATCQCGVWVLGVYCCSCCCCCSC